MPTVQEIIRSITVEIFGTAVERPREANALKEESLSEDSHDNRRISMGRASYAILEQGDNWVVLHDGETNGDFATKEAAFESAVAAASLALRQGHEVQVSAPGRDGRSDTTAAGA
jgi:hypothetical protein